VSDYIRLKNPLKGFVQTDAEVIAPSRFEAFHLVSGYLEAPLLLFCPSCGSGDCIRNGSVNVWILDIPYGDKGVVINLRRSKCLCRSCGASFRQEIPFKNPDHMITNALNLYIYGLLERGHTLKETSMLSHVDANIVKAMDKSRLLALYTDGKGHLLKPEKKAQHIAVDEFKIHCGHIYATIVIDLSDGSVIYLALGKKKQALEDFLSLVGEEWMMAVEAVACDMNSNYEQVFLERFPHIAIVYDMFHIRKNFSDMVISEVRKDLQGKLKSEGRSADAASLKHSKYLLCSSLETLERKDSQAKAGVVVVEGSTLFRRDEMRRQGGHVERYKRLIEENGILAACDMMKEFLSDFRAIASKEEAVKKLGEMISFCRGTEDPHFNKFANLLESHFDGIVSHAIFHISSGMIEGINNKSKMIMRKAFGFRDDDYFFLKIIDSSRKRTKPSSTEI
jgi:transposase